uniref:Uncharacterized protein n=1 Tax=Hemiselmis andersenii TaxID=464988 RepID=A0A6U5C111_HEMAN|mmetsp:Transcript_36317/g.85196  ORF Transcript_36317/g.85196 Transcript_36317/m.85196 type:complete len:154 (-) Transcript_36317:251-712(-)
MLTKNLALLGLVGSAVAFQAPTMVTRRDAVVTGAGAAAVAPLLRPSTANAYNIDGKAPVIVVFDETDGCQGPAGASSMSRITTGSLGNDGYCVKVSMSKIGFDTQSAIDVSKNYDIVRYGASKGTSSPVASAPKGDTGNKGESKGGFFGFGGK